MSCLWDCHMHTCFSGDSDAPVLSMIQKAAGMNLSGITITDHLDWDYAESPGLFDLDLPHYFSQLPEIARANSTSRFSVLTGIELGMQPHLAQRHQELLADYHPDYVIASCHVVQKKDPYYDSFFQGLSANEAYHLYFQELQKNILAFCDFDSLGHLDYIVRYGMRHYGFPAGALDFSQSKAQIEPVLDFLISNDKALEVNTGAFRYHLSETNPSKEILSLYHAMGGQKITLGADAHRPEDIAIGFDTLPALLSSLGFSSFCVYKKRIPQEYRF